MDEEKVFKTEYLNQWISHCYVFTTNRSVGLVKLQEIVEEKKKKSIYPREYNEKYMYVEFEDGEVWAVKNLNSIHTLSGIQWDKCFVDVSSVTIAAHHFIAARSGPECNLEEDMLLFNW